MTRWGCPPVLSFPPGCALLFVIVSRVIMDGAKEFHYFQLLMTADVLVERRGYGCLLCFVSAKLTSFFNQFVIERKIGRHTPSRMCS